MKHFEGLIIEEFTEADIPIFTPIMKRAFDDDTRSNSCIFSLNNKNLIHVLIVGTTIITIVKDNDTSKRIITVIK